MESQMYFQEPTDQEQHHLSPSDTCAACGSAKRRSPSSCLSPNRSNSKRERPVPLHSKPPLPPTSPVNFPASTFPPLRRYNSEPVPFFLNPTQPPETAPAGVSAALNTSSLVRTGSSATRGIRRTVSAPESELIGATDAIGESPNSKRLKRMRERMREMSKWCDQVIAEGDEEEDDDDDEEEEERDHLIRAEVFNHEAPKEDGIEGSESEEEAVSVEKNGENLIIHMKCPCSKAYQFLLSGNNCYYQLM